MTDFIARFKPLIEHRYGIVLHSHQERRIENALQIINDKNKSLDMIDAFISDDTNVTQAVLDAITVQESYFFRDQSLFSYLEKNFLLNLIAEKRAKKDFNLSIFSAGCANGEEIYSIAMLLDTLIDDLENWQCQLFGMDVSEHAIQMARAAVYTKRSMRTIEDKYVQRYFSPLDGCFKLKNSIKKLAEFTQGNIITPIQMHDKFDVILCRNVFIYLSKSAIELALANFSNMLKPLGRLFLGPSDFVSYVKNPLHLSSEDNVFYYTLSKPAEITQGLIKPILPSVVQSYAAAQAELGDRLVRIKEKLTDSPKTALRLIDQYLATEKPSALLYQYKAQALMTLNDMDTALEYCTLSLKLNRINHAALLLTGLIYFDKGEMSAAKTAFQNALIIKSSSIEAHYYLAQISLFEKSKRHAIIHFKQALEKAKAGNNKNKLITLPGETVDMLIREIEVDLNTLINEEENAKEQ